MVLMQILFDSLSRCFGIPFDPTSGDHRRNKNGGMTESIGALPLGESRSSRNQSNDQFHNDAQVCASSSYDQQQRCSNSAQCNNLKSQPEWKNLLERVSLRHKSTSCCGGNPLDATDKTTYSKLEQEIRHKAHLQAVQYNRRDSRSSSSSSLHKDVLRKARKESNKRKLDIFRDEIDPKRSSASSASFASRFLGSETGFQTGAMLCFANPIFDSEDDDLRLTREDRDGDETITSTLYFDAKYEHMIQNRPPMPLYREQSLSISEHHGNEIIQLFQSGGIKHEIKSIYCRRRNGSNEKMPPPPPPSAKPEPISMADSCSDAEDENLSEYRNNASFIPAPNNVLSYKSDDGFSPSYASPIRSPPSVARSRQELDVISSWVFDSNNNSTDQQGSVDNLPPSLKLMNNSSLSTQALTPTPSASDAHASPTKTHNNTYFDQNIEKERLFG